MADREAFYGDPDFVDVPMETLLSDAYNDARRALIETNASMDLRPGTVDGFETRLPQSFGADIAVAPGVGEPNAQMKDLAAKGEVKSDTVHVSVTDKDGNMVSCMPSGGWLQSSPLIPELGFCLGTRAQMFWLEEGLPASLEPGKRPRSTLSPGLVLRDGKPYMAYGSPGGDGQDQWAVLMLLRHIHANQNLQEAIDTPSILSFHQPNSFYPRAARPGLLQVEARMPDSTVADLDKRGHKIEIMDGWSLGRLCAVAREGGLLKAAANPRFMQGYAAGR
jgi:gamma-glutamyltranspeptidase/glutathione hydrolase